MGINLVSEATCREAYIDYYYRGHSANYDEKDIIAIKDKWEDKLKSWDTLGTREVDATQYELVDDEVSDARENGEERAREVTGDFDRKDNRGDVAKAAGDTTFAVAGAVGGVAGGSIVAKIQGFSNCNIGLKSGATGPNGGKNISSYIAIAIGIITAATYWIKRPNKDAAEACEKLEIEQGNAQAALDEAQDQMAKDENDIQDAADEAETVNNEANNEIKTDKANIDSANRTLMTLQAKHDSGGVLTNTEKADFIACQNAVANDSRNIQETEDEATEVREACQSDMSTYQASFDETATTMEEVVGMTDYAASFDKATKTQSKALGWLLSINAVSSSALAIKLLTKPSVMWFSKAWDLIFGGIAAAAAVSHGIAANEQFKFAKTAGNEIDARVITENLNADTNDIYETELEDYDTMMAGVEGLIVETPKDTSAAVTGNIVGENEQRERKRPVEENNDRLS